MAQVSCGVFRAFRISDAREMGREQNKDIFVLLSPHFPSNQTSENAENPTETLATQTNYFSALILCRIITIILYQLILQMIIVSNKCLNIGEQVMQCLKHEQQCFIGI